MPGVYLDRAAWGARTDLPRLGYVVPRNQFKRLICHHTVIVMQDFDGDGYLHGDVDDVRRYMRALQTSRPDLGLDVPYSFVVFRGVGDYDYIVCEGRGFDRTGAHTPGYNSSAYGVSFAGDYTTMPPTVGQLLGVRWVGHQLVDPVGAPATLSHSDTKPTQCCGLAARPAMPQVQPPFVIAAPPPPPPPVLEDLDMDSVLLALPADGTAFLVHLDCREVTNLTGLGEIVSQLRQHGIRVVDGGQADDFVGRIQAA